MKAYKKRPVNLDITTMALPITAYVSILHRISGVVLFVGISVCLYGFHLSLASVSSFYALKRMLSSMPAKVVVWVVLSTLIYHLVAGIKHLLMDIDVGDGKESGKVGAVMVVVISAVLIVLAGGWVW